MSRIAFLGWRLRAKRESTKSKPPPKRQRHYVQLNKYENKANMKYIFLPFIIKSIKTERKAAFSPCEVATFGSLSQRIRASFFCADSNRLARKGLLAFTDICHEQKRKHWFSSSAPPGLPLKHTRERYQLLSACPLLIFFRTSMVHRHAYWAHKTMNGRWDGGLEKAIWVRE